MRDIDETLGVSTIMASPDRKENVWMTVLDIWPDKLAFIVCYPDGVVVKHGPINVALLRTRVHKWTKERWCCGCRSCAVLWSACNRLHVWIRLRFPEPELIGWIIRTLETVAHFIH